MSIGGKHRQRVRWSHEPAPANDQVAVPVAIGCRSEIGRVGPHHQLIQFLGVPQVGVGMMAAEIF